jgi:RNA polymerase sigma-70 factor (ECF subfamily)
MHMVNAAVLEQWGTLTDEQVVALVLNGQTALFEVLMRRHNERVYRAARAIVRDEAEAEDVMQQAYVNAYANLRQFGGKAQFSTWLLRITANEAIARVRRRGRYEPFDEEISRVESLMSGSPRSPESRDPERLAFSGEMRALLEKTIDGLPDGAREVFVLREVEGLSTAETAGVLDVSEDVVKTRLSRARGALRRRLEAQIGTAAPDLFQFMRPRCDRVVARVLARILP